MKFFLIISFNILYVGILLFSGNGIAQDEEDKSDKTGTNPVNFSKDFRVYNEYIWLNTLGDGTQNLTTFEYRTPILEGSWQWRVKVRSNVFTADFDDDGKDDVDESGIGDSDIQEPMYIYAQSLSENCFYHLYLFAIVKLKWIAIHSKDTI